MSHWLRRSLDQGLQIIRDGRQLCVAVGRGFMHEGEQIPAQFSRAQAQFALVRVKRLVFVQLGQDAGADYRRAVGQGIFPFGERHGQQCAE